MALINEIETSKKYIGRLTFGADLLNELTYICKKNNITLGRIEAIGAVQKARIGYYNQATHNYHFNEFKKPMEIVKLSGNISLKDDEIFIHAHIGLADSKSKVYGGHLAPETIVYACEYIIESFNGDTLQRIHDPQTDLSLWKENK
jgi:uncharacterized protein